MKKILIFLLCTVILSSCTLEEFFLLPAPTAIPLPTSTNTLIPVTTMTPVTPTSTFTSTPTFTGQKTETPTPEFTATPSFTTIPLYLLITPLTATPGIEMKGFLTVNISASEFYKGKICEPNSVRIVAQAADSAGTTLVALFVRLKSKRSGAKTDWTMILIKSNGIGTFTHELIADEIPNSGLYNDVWVDYQFVAYNARDFEVGRTEVFSEMLTLLDCVPTPTALQP